MKTYIKQKNLKTGELRYLAIEPIMDGVQFDVGFALHILHPYVADKTFVYSTINEDEFTAVKNLTSFTIPIYYNNLIDKVLSGHYIVKYLVFFKDCIVFVNDNMDPIVSENAENLIRLANAQYQVNQIKQRIHPDKTVGWNTEMNYGKYAGKKLMEILKDNPDYLAWTMDNTSTRYTTFLNAHRQEIENAVSHKA